MNFKRAGSEGRSKAAAGCKPLLYLGHYTLGLVCCFLLLALNTMSLDAQNQIHLDQQVDIKLPEKKDKEALKKFPLKAEKTEKGPQTSFDGIWSVKQVNQSCGDKDRNFKVRIVGETIDPLFNDTLTGFVNPQGQFEMNMVGPEVSIKFTGMLQQKSGTGTWVKKQDGKEFCQGSISLLWEES